MFLLIVVLCQLRFSLKNLNTSHVLINPGGRYGTAHWKRNLNTSHVLINQRGGT